MLISIFLLYFLIASTFTLSKALVTVFSPIILITLRFLIGGGLLLLGSFFFGSKKNFEIKRPDYNDFLRIILALYCFGFILDNYAIVYIESFFSSLIYNLSPFFTAILSYFMFKRKLMNAQVLGLVVGFLSISGLFLNDIYLGAFFKNSFDKPLVVGAHFVLLIAVIANAYGWIIFEKLLAKGYSSTTIHCVGLLGAGFLSLGLSILNVVFFNASMLNCYPGNLPITALGSPLIDLLALVIISHIICALLYGKLLQHFSATFISFAGCITPLFTASFGFIFLNERPDWQFFLATFGVGVGLFLFYKNENRKGIYLDN